MEPHVGIEPTASAWKAEVFPLYECDIGVSRGTWTPTLPIKSRLLCQLSYGNDMVVKVGNAPTFRAYQARVLLLYDMTVVHPIGVEPMTRWLKVICSTTELRVQIWWTLLESNQLHWCFKPALWPHQLNVHFGVYDEFDLAISGFTDRPLTIAFTHHFFGRYTWSWTRQTKLMRFRCIRCCSDLEGPVRIALTYNGLQPLTSLFWFKAQIFGRNSRIWTCDLIVPSDAL